MILRVIVILNLCLGAASAAASSPSGSPTGNESGARLMAPIKAELQRKFPGARIEIYGEIAWTRGFAEEGKVFVEQVTPRGEAIFSVTPVRGIASEGSIRFTAIVPARVALKRILPGERLSSEFFVTQDVNMGAGTAYDFRGLVLPADTDLSGIETRQTILEGQILLSSAVQKTPDIRRGDSVRIRLISGGLTIQAAGVAEEPANVLGQLKVMTQKSKRQLSGRLVEPGLVEVNL